MTPAAHAAPEPIHGQEGDAITGPRNDARQAEDPNLTNPPKTDHGTVPNLHWHKASEWSHMLAGSARITAVDQDGRTFADDVNEDDLWFFPSGIPHSIQGLGEQGCEFMPLFGDASFSEDNTFLLTDWFAHTPREVLGDVLAGNFGMPEAVLTNIPTKGKHIFEAKLPGRLQSDVMSSNPVPTPPALVRAPLNVDNAFIHAPNKNKRLVVG